MSEIRPTEFLGYLRADGRVGVRNHVLVLSVVGLVNRAAERIAVAGAVLVATPYGRGQYGADKSLHRRQLIGLASNPNVAAVLIVAADRVTADDLAAAIAVTGKPVRVIALDDTHEDALELSAKGIRTAGELVHAASRLERTRQPVSALLCGIECGHSDATSGIVANPAAGCFVDLLVDHGGSAIVGEAVEWLGAEDIVARRAGSAGLSSAIVKAVLDRERAVAAAGVDLTGSNPGAENIRGGLTTIEEKSLGAIAKTGSRPVQGLLAHAEAPKSPGFFLMDGPSFSPESITGFVAAGAQLVMFTTGAGNSYCSALAPTIKVSGRPDTARRLPDQIDVDVSAVFKGEEIFEAAGRRLFDATITIASGALTWGEVHREGAEVFTRGHESM